MLLINSNNTTANNISIYCMGITSGYTQP